MSQSASETDQRQRSVPDSAGGLTPGDAPDTTGDGEAGLLSSPSGMEPVAPRPATRTVPLAVRLTGLCRTFGTLQAVNNLDLEVPTGAFFGFLGPNGAGKSTTLKMMTGLLAPTSGRIEILGYDLARQPLEVKRRIGVVPENLALFERLTGGEFLQFAGRMHGLPRQDVARRAEELLALMALDSHPRTLIVEYSHGMKKKLSLAAALIHSPQMLFLDEPFEGVDAVASRTLRALLSEATSRGMTIFVTSHVLEIVEKLCSHVAIIAHGQVVVQGPLEALKARNGGRETLEQLFLSVVGLPDHAPQKLDWLYSREDSGT